MDIDILYFKELSDLAAYGSASTNGAAEQRLKNLKLKVLQGESLRVTHGDRVILINTLEELIDFKNQYSYLSYISLRDVKDNIKELEVLRSKLKSLQNEVFTLETERIDDRLRLFYTYAKRREILCDFRSVRGCTLESKITNIYKIDFRLAYQEEISVSKKLSGDINGHLVLSAVIQTKNTEKLNYLLVCKELEVNCS